MWNDFSRRRISEAVTALPCAGSSRFRQRTCIDWQNWGIALRKVVGYFGMLQKDSVEKEKNVLPPVGKDALVQCPGFRCLAYRDLEGKWRSVFNRDELPEVLYVVE
jgi:hypothetical protein